MDGQQQFLRDVVALAPESYVDEDGTWFTLVPGDPDELGHRRSAIGIRVKIGRVGRVDPPRYEVLETSTYNR